MQSVLKFVGQGGDPGQYIISEIRSYNKMMSACFDECITSLYDKSLNDEEKGCLDRCYRKTVRTHSKFVNSINYVNLERAEGVPNV
ncbi:unnamed protein product [Blepharisma stoltei]|uniref:Mitochondrial import inner membrane translocase subunit n=1 Tax=Blepharisma stoltei TaxID=1481888 RepID=A0AAU9JXM2_9CILI|nr:unnamed protein product [Blepharisma stoltei]